MHTLTSGWDNFFLAVAGTAVVLIALLFVAASLNPARAVERGLVPRLSEALTTLLTVLGTSIVGLVPHLSRAELGLGLVGLWVIAFSLELRIQYRSLRMKDAQRLWLARIGGNQVPLLGILVAGLTVLGGAGGGLLWLLPAVLLAFAGAAYMCLSLCFAR